MSTSLASIPAYAGLAIALLAVPACGRSVPTAPDAAGSAAVAQSRSGGDPTLTFPLTDGTFTLTSAKGDILDGAYSGEAQFRSTVESSVLTVELAGGIGTLAGSGSGAFSGEGTASLVLLGTVTTGGNSTRVRINLKGRSEVSCHNETAIRVTQYLEGTMSGAGRVTAVLSHLVGNTDCGP